MKIIEINMNIFVSKTNDLNNLTKVIFSAPCPLHERVCDKRIHSTSHIYFFYLPIYSIFVYILDWLKIFADIIIPIMFRYDANGIVFQYIKSIRTIKRSNTIRS